VAALIARKTLGWLRPLVVLLLTTGVLAQDRVASSVPTWPDDSRIPPEYADRRVFLTRDKHTIVVLAPEQAGAEWPAPPKL
jgi:hypothetical protein